MNISYQNLAKKVLQCRISQLIVNEKIKAGEFKIPIHLGLGHEAISEVISSSMHSGDQILCTHRNIHYQFARGASLSEIMEEFKLSDNGLSKGRGGSMNLTNPPKSIIYTSSILGNNLCVGVGVAFAKKLQQDTNSVVIVVTGDGAMEEGALYEAIENARNLDLQMIILIENNNWSLATKIHERRKPIDLKKFSSSLGVGYTLLKGNRLDYYFDEITAARSKVILEKRLMIVEVELTTLGGWMVQTDEFPYGKYVNYHAGLAPKISLSDGVILNYDNSDPVFLIKESLGEFVFDKLCKSSFEIFSDYLTL